MFYQIIVFVLLTSAGFLICRQLLKIPKLSMKKNIKNLQTEKEKTGKRLLNRFVMPLVKPVARLQSAPQGKNRIHPSCGCHACQPALCHRLPHGQINGGPFLIPCENGVKPFSKYIFRR